MFEPQWTGGEKIDWTLLRTSPRYQNNFQRGIKTIPALSFLKVCSDHFNTWQSVVSPYIHFFRKTRISCRLTSKGDWEKERTRREEFPFSSSPFPFAPVKKHNPSNRLFEGLSFQPFFLFLSVFSMFLKWTLVLYLLSYIFKLLWGQKLNYSSHCSRLLLSRFLCSLAGATSLITSIF